MCKASLLVSILKGALGHKHVTFKDYEFNFHTQQDNLLTLQIITNILINITNFLKQCFRHSIYVLLHKEFGFFIKIVSSLNLHFILYVYIVYATRAIKLL